MMLLLVLTVAALAFAPHAGAQVLIRPSVTLDGGDAAVIGQNLNSALGLIQAGLKNRIRFGQNSDGAKARDVSFLVLDSRSNWREQFPDSYVTDPRFVADAFTLVAVNPRTRQSQTMVVLFHDLLIGRDGEFYGNGLARLIVALTHELIGNVLRIDGHSPPTPALPQENEKLAFQGGLEGIDELIRFVNLQAADSPSLEKILRDLEALRIREAKILEHYARACEKALSTNQ
jgi:hypothetical protein